MRVIDSSDPSCAKTNTSHPTGNRVDKSKSPRTLRLSLLSGKNACPCKGRTKMERSIDRFSVNSFPSRILRSRRITIEFEWNIVPGLASLEMLRKNQDDSQRRKFDSENFGDRIIFMSTFNEIDWNKRGNEEERISNSEKVREYVKRFSQGHWAFLGPAFTSPKESGIPEQHKCYNDSRRQDIQFVSGVSSLSRGFLKRRKNKDTTYFTAET